MNSKKMAEFRAMKTSLHPDCRDCSFLEFYHGGSPKERRPGLGHDGLNHLCAGRKMLYEHALPKLKKLAATWPR